MYNMTEEQIKQKAEEYLETVRERSLEPDLDTVDDYIAGWKACEEYIQKKMNAVYAEHERQKQEWNTRTRYNTEEP